MELVNEETKASTEKLLGALRYVRLKLMVKCEGKKQARKEGRRQNKTTFDNNGPKPKHTHTLSSSSKQAKKLPTNDNDSENNINRRK